jgi:hypothetical protein
MFAPRSVQNLTESRAAATMLANNIRRLVRSARPVLYHGTRFARKILKNNELGWPDEGLSAIHFSRLLHTAAYWALLPRDGDDGEGAILVLDRDRLTQSYKLESRRDEWLDLRHMYPPMYSEAEEIVWGRDIGHLHKYLVDTIWIDERTLTGKTTKQLREAAHLRLPSSQPVGLRSQGAAVPQQELVTPLLMAA